MFNFHSTASLIFGNETAINSTDQIVDLLGKNIFVITDEGLTELGLYDKTIKKLQSEVWSHQSELETHTVETHIYRLRKKILETFDDDRFIISDKDGYKIY